MDEEQLVAWLRLAQVAAEPSGAPLTRACTSSTRASELLRGGPVTSP